MRKLTHQDFEERVSISAVKNYCNEHNLVLNNEDYFIDVFSMGSGGVGQIRHMKRTNTLRLQLRCGYGRNNYAPAAVFQLNNMTVETTDKNKQK